MIKKVLGLLFLTSCAYGFSPFQYVQISTQIPAPVQQGGINISSITVTSATITNLTVANQTFQTISVATITITCSSCGIVGVKDGSSAFTGNVGEYVVSSVGVTNFPASGQFGDLASITLSAGDWNVSGNESAIIGTATWTEAVVGISTNTGNNSTNLVQGDNYSPATWASSASNPSLYALAIPDVRFSLSASTTINLKFAAVYSGGQPTAQGRISARRVR